jgi:oligogalacturonide lyase
VTEGLTRRGILCFLPAAIAWAKPPAKASSPPAAIGKFVRFFDPVTETPVVRLTDPAFNSSLPAPTNRFISVKSRYLLFSSDQDGHYAPFQLNLRTGALEKLIQPADLATHSLCLDEAQKAIYFLDGNKLVEFTYAGRKSRTLVEGVSDFSMGRGLSELVLLRGGQLEFWPSGAAYAPHAAVSWCLIRPGGKGCPFGLTDGAGAQQFWYLPSSQSGQNARDPVMLAQGNISNPVWSPGGESLLFLREVPTGTASVPEIHSVNPETATEQRITSTSQFAAFSPNADGSVFIGASRSKAQPFVTLLLPSVQRELALCEHRAKDPKSVSPVFSPDSRRVYFQSDHTGKSTLFSVNVELLIEPTAAGAA